MALELGSTIVKWLEWLDHGAESRHKVVNLRLGFIMLENSLCQPSTKWVPFLNLVKLLDTSYKESRFPEGCILSRRNGVDEMLSIMYPAKQKWNLRHHAQDKANFCLSKCLTLHIMKDNNILKKITPFMSDTTVITVDSSI